MRIALTQANSTAHKHFPLGIFGDAAIPESVINKVDRNECKRRQAAPGLKVTTKAFGIGRRFPIAQRFYE